MPGGFQWADLGLVAGVVLGYLTLIFLWPAAVLPVWWLLTHTIYRLRSFQPGESPVHRSRFAGLQSRQLCRLDAHLGCLSAAGSLRGLGRLEKKTFLATVPPRHEFDPRRWRSEVREAIVSALRQVSDALDRGEVICMFPEARLTQHRRHAALSPRLRAHFETDESGRAGHS